MYSKLFHPDFEIMYIEFCILKRIYSSFLSHIYGQTNKRNTSVQKHILQSIQKFTNRYCQKDSSKYLLIFTNISHVSILKLTD